MQHRCTYMCVHVHTHTCSHIWSNACRQHTHMHSYMCVHQRHSETNNFTYDSATKLALSTWRPFPISLLSVLNSVLPSVLNVEWILLKLVLHLILNPVDVRNDNLGITHPTKYFVYFFSYCWPLTLSLLRRLLSYYTTLCKIILSYLASISVECFSSSWCTQVPTCFLLLGKNMKTLCLKLPVTCGTLDRNFCIIDFFFSL